MTTVELEEIKIQREAAQKRLRKLQERESQIYRELNEAERITIDERLKTDDIDADTVNYIMGQSAGYVSGFTSAIITVISALAAEYRDITMTEDELSMLAELGAEKERAKLKDYKQKKLLEDAGWEINFGDLNHAPSWGKKCEKED